LLAFMVSFIFYLLFCYQLWCHL